MDSIYVKLGVLGLALLGILFLAFGGKDDGPVIPPVVPPVTENRAPIALTPFYAECDVHTKGARVDFGLNYRSDTDCPTATYYGAYDPDGDELEYSFVCPWSVFTKAGKLIKAGEWVTAGDLGEFATVVVFAGYTGQTTPYPLIPSPGGSTCRPMSAEECDASTLVGTMCGSVGAWSFQYMVRDPSGATASAKINL